MLQLVHMSISSLMMLDDVSSKLNITEPRCMIHRKTSCSLLRMCLQNIILKFLHMLKLKLKQPKCLVAGGNVDGAFGVEV